MSATPLDLDFLASVHAEHGLILRSADGASFVYLVAENVLDIDPVGTVAQGQALVSELIRLARIGHKLEQATADRVGREGRA